LATSSETGYGKEDVLDKIRFVLDLVNTPAEEETEAEAEE